MSIRRLASYGGGFHMTRTVYSIDADAPTLWAGMYKDPPRIAVPIAKIEGFDTYHQHNYVYGEGGISPTILRNCEKGYPPLIKVVARLNIKDHDINRRIYSSEGIAPTIRAAPGGNSEPKIVVGSDGQEGLEIRDGKGHTSAHEGDGVKLIFPTGTASCSRVRNQIAPTIMAGPVVGVVVRE